MACQVHTTSTVHCCLVINARRMCMSVIVVCLYVCLSVCYQSTDFFKMFMLNIPDNFTLISKGFQLAKQFSLKNFRSIITASIVCFSTLSWPFVSVTVNSIHCTLGSLFYPYWACTIYKVH